MDPGNSSPPPSLDEVLDHWAVEVWHSSVLLMGDVRPHHTCMALWDFNVPVSHLAWVGELDVFTIEDLLQRLVPSELECHGAMEVCGRFLVVFRCFSTIKRYGKMCVEHLCFLDIAINPSKFSIIFFGNCSRAVMVEI
ncbi:hypothetical protein D1007_52972 [Hordeum vulgare]|nr:hypothetical protein D1007_52972 [Hordeum vulgare]